MLAAAIGIWLYFHVPFPAENVFLQLILVQKPALFQGIKWSYTALLFTTPLFGWSMLLSAAYIFVMKQERRLTVHKLPAYPPPADRRQLYLVIGEVHHPKKREPVETPQWLAIPERGLYTGVAVIGAIGSGKTSVVSKH